MKKFNENSPLREALISRIPAINQTLFFGVFINVLVLSPSAYMMEVYDRVVNSQSHTTLLMLTIAVAGAYMLLESLEWVRHQIMQHAGVELDRNVRDPLFASVFSARTKNFPAAGPQALRDLKTLREFLPSPAFLAILDTPFAMLVLVILFLMNPMLGWFAVAGALLQFGIGTLNERRIGLPLLAANRSAMISQGYADEVIRNAQVIESMGMAPDIHRRWSALQQEFLLSQATASDHAGTNAVLSKLVQNLLSSLLLGVGCWLTMKGELHGSGMIVGSILGGKVLSPLVQIIGNWRQTEEALEAFRRLDILLREFPLPEKKMALPPPTGLLSVEGVIAGAPRSQIQILRGVSFRVAPGGSLAIVGPSASGKTTLARLLTGIWPAAQGKVRLDGNDLYQWNKDELGQHVGYLPQSVELFEGSIAENISRFGEPDKQKLSEACKMVGLESFIAQLPDGYETRVGEEGSLLSGGERQRIALARALYGMPKLVVLDEPNASLDEAGDAALINAVKLLRQRGTTVIVITHRLNIISAIEHMLLLVDGQIQRLGTCREVLEALQSPPTASSCPSGRRGALN